MKIGNFFSSYRLLCFKSFRFQVIISNPMRMSVSSFLSFFILLLLLFQSQNNFAQKCYLFRTYTVEDGLPHNTIFSINQDNEGYLWIATDGGISRFDGYRFDNTLIPEVNKEQAFSQYADKSPAGRLAFATFMNGVIVEQEDGSFKQYLRREKQLGKNVVRTLKWLSNDTILFSESRNINVIAGDSIYQLYDWGRNGNLFQTIEYDRKGNIWFGGLRGLGIIFGDDKEKQPLFVPELEDIFVMKILFSSETKLLVGTNYGYYEMDIISAKKGNLRYSISQPFRQLTGQVINHIYCDKQHDIWVSFVSNGVFQIHDNQIVRHITYESGLPSTGAMCVFQDNEENYWFGTSEGISRLYSFDDYSYTYNENQLTGIGFFEQDSYKRLWLSSGTTLYFIENDLVGSSNINKTPFAGNDFMASAFVNNRGYFFTDLGVFSMPCHEKMRWANLEKIIDFKESDLLDLKCFYFEDNDDKVLWLGVQDGIYTYTGNKLSKATILSEKPVNLRPAGIIKDKFGYYWVGDYTFGLHRFQLKSTKNNDITLQLKNTYESLKPDSAFATAWVQDLILDSKGDIWLSSLYTGVYKLKIDEDGVKDYTLYSTKKGLSSNDITQIIEGKDGSIWFATRNGADRLITDDNENEKIIHYNYKNGFGRFVYQILPDDSVTYISYEEGFFAVNNRLKNEPNNQKLDISISAITVMGRSDSTAMRNKNKVYSLPFNRNFISFEFITIRLKDNEGIEYQYKLDGIDKEWSTYSNRHFANYNSLPHGKYAFNVRAKMINNDIEGPVTTYRFRINPPFYLTLWFFLLMLLLIAGIGFFIYSNRIRHLIKLQKLRVKIASDLHDDVGSTLSSISIMSDLLQSQLDNTSRSEQMIHEIGANAHAMLDSMDDIIWSVNPTNDKFQNLALRIREYAIPLFEMKDIGFSIVTPEEMNKLSLPMDIRRNAYLIAKEAVNNLVKYSECTQASIEFGFAHSILTMHVKDNGKGFDMEQINHSRNGLRNMKRRSEQIRGVLDIHSEIGKGTDILFSVKII